MTVGDTSVVDMGSRLRDYKYSEAACRAAIRGEKVPHALGLPLIRICLIRGIRYNDGFGEELRGVLPAFTRALNARSIMSNRIPAMNEDDEIPYCIWYPQTATEATYRELARRYPHMKYNVGRACAVAGFVDLYKELDILPDVHIAEEARECGNMSIYDHIMSRPIRYDVMDDYERTIAANATKPGACLNGDTAVCHSLDRKQEFRDADEPDDEDEAGEAAYWDVLLSSGFATNTFNITEDMNIKEKSRAYNDTPRAATSTTVLELLSMPLPLDLPTVDKDLLILMAAYYGNVDRYVRLRRPNPLPQEMDCCVRGIYHNTMFALWFSRQEQSGTAKIINGRVRKAISARMIMNNVLSRMMDDTTDDPYLIWYPSIAAESTYRELFRIRPSMAPQILRACIAGNYVSLFNEISAQIEPDTVVVAKATAAGGFFKDAIERRLHELGGKTTPIHSYQQWQRSSRRDLEIVHNYVKKAGEVTTGFELLYDAGQCNAEGIEVLASMPTEWREVMGSSIELDYIEWPRKSSEVN